MIGPRPDAAPTLVLLHEGLGCVGLWGDFPDRLQQATGCGVFVYSRAGYGQSSPVEAAAAADLHARRGARDAAALLDAIGFQRGLLIGHSDGASIAAIYAGTHQDHRVGGLVLIAPHFFTEDIGHRLDRRGARRLTRPATCVRGWRAGMPTSTTPSSGWNGAWLDPGFPPAGISPSSSPISACRC